MLSEKCVMSWAFSWQVLVIGKVPVWHGGRCQLHGDENAATDLEVGDDALVEGDRRAQRRPAHTALVKPASCASLVLIPEGRPSCVPSNAAWDRGARGSVDSRELRVASHQSSGVSRGSARAIRALAATRAAEIHRQAVKPYIWYIQPESSVPASRPMALAM